MKSMISTPYKHVFSSRLNTYVPNMTQAYEPTRFYNTIIILQQIYIPPTANNEHSFNAHFTISFELHDVLYYFDSRIIVAPED